LDSRHADRDDALPAARATPDQAVSPLRSSQRRAVASKRNELAKERQNRARQMDTPGRIRRQAMSTKANSVAASRA